MMTLEQIKNTIAAIPDYPKEGIIFRDITPLLKDPAAFSASISHLAQHYQDQKITQIAAVEARGFIFGAALANALNCGLTLLRKPGKLPGELLTQHYQLEYGEDALQMRADAFTGDDNVLVVDDLLATGGTVAAAIQLIKQTQASIHEAAFVVLLDALQGEQKLQQQGVTCYTLCRF